MAEKLNESKLEFIYLHGIYVTVNKFCSKSKF